eukprot:tig00000093_g3551.t1
MPAGPRRSVMSVNMGGGGGGGGSADSMGAAAPGEHGLHAVERSIHSLLFALTDRTANGKENSLVWLVLLPVLFVAADFFQLIGLTLGTGWHPDSIAWLQRISAAFSIAFLGGWTVYVLTFWVLLGAIGLMLGMAAFATYSFNKNNVRILPIRIVRILAQIFQTALYIPALEILSQEISVVGPRASMLWRGTSAIAWEWIMYAALSSGVLALFVPFMLVIALIYNDTSPLSRNVESCAHGRVAFLYTVVRTGIVFCTRFVDAKVTMAVLVVGLGACLLFLLLALPFYRPFMNKYYAGLFATAWWSALASLILSGIGEPDSAARFAASVACEVLGGAAFVGGWLLCARRHAALKAKGRRVAEEGVPASAAAGILALLLPQAPPVPGDRPGGGGGFGGGFAAARTRRQSTVNFAGGAGAEEMRGAARRYMQQHPSSASLDQPLANSDRPRTSVSDIAKVAMQARALEQGGAAAAGPGSGSGSGSSSGERTGVGEPPVLRVLLRAVRERARLFWIAFEVEVAARFVHLDHSDAAFEAADAVYRAGYTLFPDSAYVRLAHSTYIAVHRNNPMGALQVQREAWALKPAFDVRFALVAMKRDFEQKTASSNLGEAKGMNFISVLEFRRLHEAAVTWHNESIAQQVAAAPALQAFQPCFLLWGRLALRALWKALARTRLSESALATVPRKLEVIDRAMRTASDSYRALLQKYPNSKLLLREYGTFLNGVGNDPDLAQLHFAAADEIEDQEEGDAPAAEMRSAGGGSQASARRLQAKYAQGRMKGGGGGGGYAASAHGSATSSEFAARARGEAARQQGATQDIKHVQRVRLGILGGLALIIVLTAVFFIVIQQVFKRMGDSIQRITAASSQMRRLLEFCFMTRSLNLYGSIGDEAEFEAWRAELHETTCAARRGWGGAGRGGPPGADLYSADSRGLYLGFPNGVGPSSTYEIASLWTDPKVTVTRYLRGPPAAEVDQRVSLWAAGSYLNGVLKLGVRLWRGAGQDLAGRSMEELSRVADNEAFRFVQKNAPGNMLEVASRANRLYEEEIYSTTFASQLIIGAILAAILLSLVVLGACVFRPAFNNVRRSMRGVNEIIMAMPPFVRKAMYSRYATMRRVDDPGSEHDEEEEGGGEGDTGSAMTPQLSDRTAPAAGGRPRPGPNPRRKPSLLSAANVAALGSAPGGPPSPPSGPTRGATPRARRQGGKGPGSVAWSEGEAGEERGSVGLLVPGPAAQAPAALVYQLSAAGDSRAGRGESDSVVPITADFWERLGGAEEDGGEKAAGALGPAAGEEDSMAPYASLSPPRSGLMALAPPALELDGHAHGSGDEELARGPTGRPPLGQLPAAAAAPRARRRQRPRLGPLPVGGPAGLAGSAGPGAPGAGAAGVRRASILKPTVPTVEAMALAQEAAAHGGHAPAAGAGPAR